MTQKTPGAIYNRKIASGEQAPMPDIMDSLRPVTAAAYNRPAEESWLGSDCQEYLVPVMRSLSKALCSYRMGTTHLWNWDPPPGRSSAGHH